MVRPFIGSRKEHLMQRILLIVACAYAAIVCGCASPSLHPLYGPETLTEDPGLVGEWATEGPTVTRIVVTEAADGRYHGALTIRRGTETRASVGLELALTDIGEDRYVDLFLARADRETLAGHYGFLALPVHQFMMLRRDDNKLRVWAFNADWMRRAGAENRFACEVLPVAGQEMAVVTATTSSMQQFIERHAHDTNALNPPMVFHRVGHDEHYADTDGNAPDPATRRTR
jgi:hypothetical protein